MTSVLQATLKPTATDTTARTGKLPRAMMASALALAAALAACSPAQHAPADGNTPTTAAAPAANPRNPALDAAASPAENLVEAVLAGDRAAQDRAYGDLEQGLTHLTPAQLGASTTSVDQVNRSLRSAWQAGDRPGAAMAAVNLYGRLQQAKDWAGARVPLAVSMLDHAGFKSRLLVAQPKVNWQALRSTASDAAREMTALDTTLKDANLKQVTRGIVDNLAAGAKAQDKARVDRAARDLLAVVDLLEQQYGRQATAG